LKNHTIIKIKPLGFQWETSDPFLFCVHHEDFYPKANREMGPDATFEGRNIGQDFELKDGWRMYHGDRVPGFPQHPHRGFETITIVRKGVVDHADSLGAFGRYGSGDVQWMTAGRGIQHSEMFPLLNKHEKNTTELFQIWLNLPAASKLTEPNYTMFWRENIPIIQKASDFNTKVEIAIIAGYLEGINAPNPPPDSWAADPQNEVLILTINMDANASWIIPPAKPGLNRTLYFYDGESIMCDKQTVLSSHGIELISDKSINIKNGKSRSSLLLLQGKPITEPVVQYGPFVMNTKAEIQQTFDDFRNTEFGGWPWNRNDPVNKSNEGRFAKHADGIKETPKEQ
jgi:quercetin 2,3-dioxygenase